MLGEVNKIGFCFGEVTSGTTDLVILSGTEEPTIEIIPVSLEATNGAYVISLHFFSTEGALAMGAAKGIGAHLGLLQRFISRGPIAAYLPGLGDQL